MWKTLASLSAVILCLYTSNELLEVVFSAFVGSGMKLAWITSALAAVGDIAGPAANVYATDMTNKSNREMHRETTEFNRKEAELNRAFQERMSNSAYQRGMDDMKKAGLNPMLAFSQGGASAPSGSTATGSTSRDEVLPLGRVLEKAGSSALSVQQTTNALKQQDADRALTEAAAMEKMSNVMHNTASAKNLAVTNQTMEAELPKRRAEAHLGVKQAEWDQSALTFDNITRRVGEAIGVLGSGVRSIFTAKMPRTGDERTKYENKVLRRQNSSYRDALSKKGKK